MSKFSKTIVAACGLVALLSVSSQAFAASDTASASVTVVAPVSVVKTQDMSFGTIAPGTTSGDVVLSSSGVRSVSSLTGPHLIGGSGGGTVAHFTVTGSGGFTYTVSLSATGANGFTLHDPTPSAPIAGIHHANIANFDVGASLTVPANTAAGLYIAGTITMSADYD